MCSLGWGVPGRPVRGCDWEPGKNRAGKRREGGVQTELQTGGGGRGRKESEGDRDKSRLCHCSELRRRSSTPQTRRRASDSWA